MLVVVDDLLVVVLGQTHSSCGQLIIAISVHVLRRTKTQNRQTVRGQDRHKEKVLKSIYIHSHTAAIIPRMQLFW